jgi:hypothetical protein
MLLRPSEGFFSAGRTARRYSHLHRTSMQGRPRLFVDAPANSERRACTPSLNADLTPCWFSFLNVGLCHPISMPLSASLTGRPTPLGGRPSTSVLCSGFNDCSQHGRPGSLGRPCLSLAVWLCHQISMPLSALMFCRPGQFPVGFPFADIPADTALR